MRNKEQRARIKLEDGSVIHCTAREIPLLVQYRLKARMDISMFRDAHLELTGTTLNEDNSQSCNNNEM